MPSALDLLSSLIDDVWSDVTGHLAMGLVPGTMSLCLSVALVSSVILSMAGAVLLNEPEVFGMWAGAWFLGTLALFFAVLPPVTASVVRGMAEVMAGQRKLSWRAALVHPGRDLFAIYGVTALVTVLVMAGIVMCYVPGLLAVIVLQHALPAVAIDRLSPADAVRCSARHFRAHPGWNLAVGGVLFGIAMVLTYLPLIGLFLTPPIYYRYLLMVYRVAFDGGSPAEWTPREAIHQR